MNTNNELIFDNLERMNNILVFVGTSGSGKSTLVNAIKKTLNIPQLVTTTTREPRHHEIDGEDYYFISKEQFENKMNAGLFVETTEYAGNMYGLTQSEINKNSGNVSCVITDVSGARKIADLYPDRVLVFWLDSSPMGLVKRMRKRGDGIFSIIKRLFQAFNSSEFSIPSPKFIDVSFTAIHSEDSVANNFGIVYYKLLTAEYEKNSRYLSQLERKRKGN